MERRFAQFVRVHDGVPSVITAATIQPEERNPLTWTGTASLPYESEGEGLPRDGELERIGKIEDQLIDTLERGGALYVGHVTGSDRTRVMFYARAEGPRSLHVKTGLLKKEEIDIEWRHDPEWSLYDLELQPTAEEAMLDRFRNLWYQLFQHGDNPDLTRQVDFTFIFPSAEEGNAFLADAAAAGYTSAGDPWQGDDERSWCEVYKDTAIAPEVMVPHCVALEEMAGREGGVFDGWACPVTK